MSDSRKSWKPKPSLKKKDKEDKRKSLGARLAKTGSREGVPTTPENERRADKKKWRTGDELSPGTLAQQRNIEQFLLHFEMKRLRGTSWRYFDIRRGSLEDSTQEEGAEAAEDGAQQPPAKGKQRQKQDAKDKKKADAKAKGKDPADSAASSASLAQTLGAEEEKQDVLFVIPPGGVRPESVTEHMITFARRGFRVISPALPETLDDFEDYVCGFLLIMRHEKIARAHFFGLAMGAMIVEYLMYRYPSRLLTVTLAHCSPPDEEIVTKCEKAIKNQDFSKDWLTHYLLGYKITSRDLDVAVPGIESDEKLMWLNFMKRFQIPKSTANVFTHALAAYHRDVQYIPEDFARFKGPILLIDCDYGNSHPTYEAQFVETKMLHPKAAVKKYEHKQGPLYTLIRGRKSAKLVAKFITEWVANRRRKQQQQQQGESLDKSSTSASDKSSSAAAAVASSSASADKPAASSASASSSSSSSSRKKDKKDKKSKKN